MSGYDRHHDYGGPPVTWLTYAGIVVFAAVLAGGVLWLAG